MAKAAFPYAWKAGSPPAGAGTRRAQPPLFDAAKATAHSLQSLLVNGTLRSTDLVEEYVSRIEKYNGYLRAVSEYAPNVMQRARELDERRAAGEFLGPLHGIPVLVKDTFDTEPSMGMGTTAGVVALIGAKASKNAEVVDKLLEAGAIILGKTTVSEISFHKGSGIPCGWSATAGQGQSPYVRGGFDTNDTIGGHTVPGGSSSGLSIAIAAGLAAGGVGSDTEASVTAPAVRASLFGMRPSTGIISTKGTIGLASSFDTPGPMAKDVRDLADMLTILVDPTKTTVPAGGYASNINGDWKSLKIGTLDPQIWQYPEGLVKPVPEATEQMFKAYKEAYAHIEKLAGVYHANVDLRPAEDFTFKGASSVYSIIDYEFVGEINKYLAGLTTTAVRSLQELVDWNEKHFAEAITSDYPNQDQLVNALKIDLSAAELQAIRQHYLDVGASVDATFEKYGIDIIVGPGDCFLTNHASANGYPIVAVPLNTYLDLNGRPVGLQAIAGKHNEALLLSFLSAYEASFPPRQPPTAYLHSEDWSPSVSQH